jgi:hypothetical protein
LRASARLENTSRADGTGDLIDTRVDLTNRLLQLQTEWQISPEWQVFAEWRNYSSHGQDFYGVRNAYSEVIDYLPMSMNRTEHWAGLGLNYRVSNRFQAQCMAYSYQWMPPAESVSPKIRWNSASLLLVMKL